jgi:glyoxylate reductase
MADPPTVYVTRSIPDAGLSMLESECNLEVWTDQLPPETETICDRLAELEADGLICLLSDKVDGTVMDASPNLDVVSTYSVGYDHVDIEAAADRGIAVGHTPGVLTETTADLAWALLLTTARRVVEGYQHVRDDEWETWHPRLLTGQDIHRQTLGIVGLGDIGTAVAKRAAGFDLDVVYAHTERRNDVEDELADLGVDTTYVSHDELFERSNLVSLHVPLTEETAGLVGEDELRQLPNDAVLVNTSRGGVVETEALERALANDWIARAGSDVTDPEPLPANHSLMKHAPEKFVVTPHIGSASVDTRDRMAEMAAANVLAGLHDEPLPHAVIDPPIEDNGHRSRTQ